MADRFECDKCHQVFPSGKAKVARLSLTELAPWTDHPGRPAYDHQSELCRGCFDTLKTAISRPHRPPAKVLSPRHTSISVGQPTEHCEECGAPIAEDLSCTPGCAGMQGVTEARAVIQAIDKDLKELELQNAFDLLMKLQTWVPRDGHARAKNLYTQVQSWLQRMVKLGYQPTKE